jgi:gamma-butyrobetaine dioxygenase
MHKPIDLSTCAASALARQVARLDHTDDSLRLKFTDGQIHALSGAVLLFDAPDQFCAHSGQRRGPAAGACATITNVTTDGDGVVVTFEDGAQRTWPIAALARLARPGGPDRSARLWVADPALRVASAASFMTDDSALRSALAAIADDGAVLLKGAPAAPGELEAIVGRFGYMRETNYGRLFDVRVTAAPDNLAFTDLGLAPHTDNPYRDPPPSLQLLHCIETADHGGETILVDGFAAAETLKRTNAAAFDALCATPILFAWRDTDNLLQSCAPMIEQNSAGAVRALRVNDRALAAQPGASWRNAYHTFSEILADPAAQLRLTLEVGDILIFDNRRILHGRTAYSGAARWLQGCYADIDGLLSRLAVLERAEASARAEAAIAALAGPAGDEHYGEGVSLRSHSLQAAALASRQGHDPEMIAAALLHDIGWTLGGAHEVTGAAFVESRFGAAVAAPIRAHVEAKRFLVASEPAYEAALSPASRETLIRQGGPMTPTEAEAFCGTSAFDRAIALRRIDDQAKFEGGDPVHLEAYRELLNHLALIALRGDDL